MARRLCCEWRDELAQSFTALKNRLGALTHHVLATLRARQFLRRRGAGPAEDFEQRWQHDSDASFHHYWSGSV